MRKLKHLFMLCLFGMISIGANATVYSGPCGDNAQWSLDSSTGLLSITGYGDMTDYSVVPSIPWYKYISYIKSLYIGDQITSIGNYAFYCCRGLTNVPIPNSVTSIGARAFGYCEGLTSITIPKYVTSIDETAFSELNFLTTQFINNSALDAEANNYWGAIVYDKITDDGFKMRNHTIVKYIGDATIVKIPNLVTSIGPKTFYGCSSLTSVTIPNSVTSIGSDAFSYCSGLTSVVIPESVTSIGNSAFYGCSGLTGVVIPNSVISIGDEVFGNCSSLKDLIYNNTIFVFMPAEFNGQYNIPQGILTIAGHAFYNCRNLTSVTIPKSLTSIGKMAFYGCSGLTSVTIPNTVTSIGDAAFYDCVKLKSVTIPNFVTEIGINVFHNCRGLTSVTIPNSVTSIGKYAFESCVSLKSVTIPNSVISIEDYAFSDCSGLTSVYVGWKDANKIPSISSYVFPTSTCNLYVPTGTRSIYQSKNYWKGFKSIVELIGFYISTKDCNDEFINVDKDMSVTLCDDINSIDVPQKVEDITITYTRNFEKAGVWQAWYMPFDVDFDDMKDAYDVAQIHGVLLDKDNNAVLAFLKLDDGTVNANTPYVVRPKKSGEVAITTATDLLPTQSKSFLMMSATDKYTIGGVYEQTTTPGNWYALNLDGQFQFMGSGVYLRPFRIYMTIDPRDDNPYATSANANAKMDIVVIGDDETTGIESLTPALSEGEGAIYNLSGLRVNSIQKGQIYIMNGKKYIAK